MERKETDLQSKDRYGISKLQAVGFDLDGTLWDSTRTVAATWQRICREDHRVRHVPSAGEIGEIMGLTLEGIARQLFPYLPLAQGLEILKKCCEEENEDILQRGGQLFEGLEEVLASLCSRYRLFIVSNCQEGYIEAFLTYHQLGRYFCDYENHGRTGLSKGENIRLVMERNQIRQAVYIGDTQGDCDAAISAGVPFIHAAYGFGSVEEDVPRLGQITELLRLLEMDA